MKSLTHYVFIAFFIFSGVLSAQENDSTQIALRKNTIRWNLTPMAVVGPKSLVFGYERVVNSHQSFSVNIGYLERKKATKKNGEPLNLFDHSSNFGYVLAADYRFYFKNRNTKPAPDGLYWGPYAGAYKMSFEGTSKVLDKNDVESVITLNSGLQMYSVGVQLGYQFVLLNDRFSIDLMLMGPSLTRYRLDLGFDGGVKLDPENEYYDDIKEIIDYFLPGAGVIIDGQQFSETGRLSFNHAGFRYGVQLGFRF